MTHVPVLLNEMLDSLTPKDDEVYVDATFGGGGYSRAILEAANCRVIGVDRDPEAVQRGKMLEDQFSGRFQIFQGTFKDLKTLLEGMGISKVQGFVFDFGVSSYQIDEPERGFSFRFEGPLDMRMSQEGLSAADVVNTYSEKDLADIFFQYGEERKSRAIARKIVAIRQEEPFRTTTQLSDVIKSVVKPGKDGQNPATLTFQALRIFVNNELNEIDQGLKIAEEYLEEGGRLVVVTFHSLEDRLVKQFLKMRQGKQEGYLPGLVSRHLPDQREEKHAVASFSYGKNKRGITPSLTELRLNPRARSARLRTAIRCESFDKRGH